MKFRENVRIIHFAKKLIYNVRIIHFAKKLIYNDDIMFLYFEK